MKKVVFFGYNDTGYAALTGLIVVGADVVAIVVPDGVEAYRTERFQALAIENGIRLFRAKKRLSAEILEYFIGQGVDWIVVASYPYIIQIDNIGLKRINAINIHGGMLPKYRGANTLNWAIANGETEMGLTIHKLTMEIDQGDILHQELISIDKFEDAGLVREKLIRATEQTIIKIWHKISNLYARAIPQDESLATYFRKRTLADSQLYFKSNDARGIVDLVRAVASPYPNAFIVYKGVKYFIPNAVLVTKIVANSNVGDILHVDRRSIDVSVGDGSTIVKLYNLYDSTGQVSCREIFNLGDSLT